MAEGELEHAVTQLHEQVGLFQEEVTRACGHTRPVEQLLRDEPVQAHRQPVIARVDRLRHRRRDASAEPQGRRGGVLLVEADVQVEDEADELFHARRLPGRLGLLGPVVEIHQDLFEQGVEDLVAIREEAVQRRHRDLGPLGDGPGGRRVDPRFADDLLGSFEDAMNRSTAPLLGRCPTGALLVHDVQAFHNPLIITGVVF